MELYSFTWFLFGMGLLISLVVGQAMGVNISPPPETGSPFPVMDGHDLRPPFLSGVDADTYFLSGARPSALKESNLSYGESIGMSNSVYPVHAGSIENNAAWLFSPTSVCVSGHYAYVASSNALDIINISDSAHPVLVGSIVAGEGGAIIERPMSVCVSGHYAFVVGTNNVLEIVDVSNPAAPVHAG